jgi:hypothetical protein
MDCFIKTELNQPNITIASVHSLRSLGQAYGRISLRSKAAPINLPSMRGVICFVRLGVDFIFRMIHIGLCNSVMHWRYSSTNHDNAAFLIVFGSTSYLWGVATLMLFAIDFQVPTTGKFSYILPVLSFFGATLISYITFKNPLNYLHALRRYKSMTRIGKYAINALSLIYVLLSPAFYLMLALVTSGK